MVSDYVRTNTKASNAEHGAKIIIFSEGSKKLSCSFTSVVQ